MDELVIEATLENMAAVLGFVETRLADCSEKIKNQIALVIDEVFSNIVFYAYNPETGGAKVRIAVESDDIILEFEDRGAPFDPLAVEDPDISLPAEERGTGGLGILMVKRLMDSVEYRREGNKNILTIKKRLVE